MSTRFRRATLPAALAAAALAMGVASPVAQAQTRPFTTVLNEDTGTYYTVPTDASGTTPTNPQVGLGTVPFAPNWLTDPNTDKPEIQFRTDAWSDDPCEVTFSITNATNGIYQIVWRIDGETVKPGTSTPWAEYDGRRGVLGPGAGAPDQQYEAGKSHTWGWQDARTTETTIKLKDVENLPHPANDAHTIRYALIGLENNYINRDVSALKTAKTSTTPAVWKSQAEWKSVDVKGCAEPPEECPVCEDSGSLGSIAEGSLGSAAGSLPLLIPVALIGGSLAAAPMIQQSLAGLNVQVPALPEFPPLAGSAMPGTPPVVGPPPAPAVPNPDNGRG